MLPVAPGGSRAASNAGNSKRGVRRPSTSSGTASAALPRPSIHQALHHFRRTSTLLSPPYGTSSSGLDNEPHTAPSSGGIVDRANASFFDAAPHLLTHQQRQRAPDPVTIVRRSHDGVQVHNSIFMTTPGTATTSSFSVRICSATTRSTLLRFLYNSFSEEFPLFRCRAPVDPFWGAKKKPLDDSED